MYQQPQPPQPGDDRPGRRVTVPQLRSRKGQGPKIAMVTAYDATLALLFEEAGVDAILVGDSLGMVVQGAPTTLGVTVADICYHGRCVRSVVRRAHLVGDMPFLSATVSTRDALRNAGRLIQRGGFEAVKIEGGQAMVPAIRAIVEAGIPVMGHLGLLPQRVHALGGYRVQGREPGALERLIEDAQALVEAGAYSMVLEGIPTPVAQAITDAVSVPTIGIGAGPHCDGQVLVGYDLLGMGRGRTPTFVKKYAELADATVEAAQRFVHEVREGAFPDQAHAYGG